MGEKSQSRGVTGSKKRNPVEMLRIAKDPAPSGKSLFCQLAGARQPVLQEALWCVLGCARVCDVGRASGAVLPPPSQRPRERPSAGQAALTWEPRWCDRPVPRPAGNGLS